MGVRISSLTAMAEAVATGDLLPLVNVSESSDKTKKATIAQVRSAIVPIVEADQSLSDVTTLDVSTSKHGYVPKAPNDTAKFLRGDATWATPSAYDMLSTLTASEISITGATTATISRMHVCSGTSANYTVTLPAASGNTGKLIGFRMDPALTKIVTLDGNGSEKINDVTTRLLRANESCVLYCDGSNWFKVAGNSIAMTATMRSTSGQTLTTGTITKVTLNSSDYTDPAAMVNTSLNRIDVIRPGVYIASLNISFVNGSTMQAAGGYVYLNGARRYAAFVPSTGANSFPNPFVSQPMTLSAGDYVEAYAFQNSGGNVVLNSQTLGGGFPDSAPILSLTEQIGW
jgi:hypothetical protein